MVQRNVIGSLQTRIMQRSSTRNTIRQEKGSCLSCFVLCCIIRPALIENTSTAEFGSSITAPHASRQRVTVQTSSARDMQAVQ